MKQHYLNTHWFCSTPRNAQRRRCRQAKQAYTRCFQRALRCLLQGPLGCMRQFPAQAAHDLQVSHYSMKSTMYVRQYRSAPAMQVRTLSSLTTVRNSPVQPTISCLWVVESDRMPEVIVVCPLRGARSQRALLFSAAATSEGTCLVTSGEPGRKSGVRGGVARALCSLRGSSPVLRRLTIGK